MVQKRRKLTGDFKFQVALSAIKEEDTLSALSQKFEVHPTMILKWKKQLLNKEFSVFSQDVSPAKKEGENRELTALQAKVGELTMALDFLKKKLPH